MLTLDEPRFKILNVNHKLPLSFVPNAGQKDDFVLFYTSGRDFQCSFHLYGVSVTYFQISEVNRILGGVLEWRFLDANENVRVTGGNKLPGIINYFKGKRKYTNLPTYQEVRYENVWHGIEIIY